MSYGRKSLLRLPVHVNRRVRYDPCYQLHLRIYDDDKIYIDLNECDAKTAGSLCVLDAMIPHPFRLVRAITKNGKEYISSVFDEEWPEQFNAKCEDRHPSLPCGNYLHHNAAGYTVGCIAFKKNQHLELCQYFVTETVYCHSMDYFMKPFVSDGFFFALTKRRAYLIRYTGIDRTEQDEYRLL